VKRVLLAFVVVALAPSRALAGPPFVTDDPVPTEYRNWEIYTGFLYANDGPQGVSAGLPFAEFNYGAMPNVQVSISSQLTQGNVSGGGPYTYGSGATDFGIKVRFVQESSDLPQIALFPSVQVPATTGHAVTLLPIWLQKSSGPWTAFGGGGVYLNAGPGMRDYTFVGGALERTLSPGTTIGGELFHQSADTIHDTDTTGANVGAIFQVGAYHAILFSFGRAFHGDNTFSGYASYEFELGPKKAP
jgi:hypothetical protein